MSAQLRPLLRPLREPQLHAEPELALAARLLAHAEPLGRSEARKRRVWQALGAGRSSRLGFRLTALRVALAALLCAAASSATVGGFYVQHVAKQRELALARRYDNATQAKSPRRSQQPRAAAPELAAPVVAPAHAVATGAPAATPEHAPLPHAKPEPRVKASPSEADAELLVEALRARTTGNPQRVSALVEQYRAKHPQGVLQEEALILAIEAAVAQRSPRAGSLAREYLARFPQGRFAMQARRALTTDAR